MKLREDPEVHIAVPLNVWVVFVSVIFLLCPATTDGQAPAPASPGPEHEILHSLEGDWQVFVKDEIVGSATARLRLGDRFLEVELVSDSGPVRHAIYTFGFDRRHGVYTVVAFDDSGTYSVTARGMATGGRIMMYGKDEDPVMRSMGLDKEFVIVLDVQSDGKVLIETLLVDTRTPDRNEMPFLSYELRRLR